MTLRLSKPNVRTFLTYSSGGRLIFSSDPSNSIFFESLEEEGGISLRAVKIGKDEVQSDSFLAVNEEGRLYLAPLPQVFTNIPLRTNRRFYLGKEEVFILDDTPWTQANSAWWKNLLVFVLILLIAAILAYAGRNSHRKDLSVLFYRD